MATLGHSAFAKSAKSIAPVKQNDKANKDGWARTDCQEHYEMRETTKRNGEPLVEDSPQTELSWNQRAALRLCCSFG